MLTIARYPYNGGMVSKLKKQKAKRGRPEKPAGTRVKDWYKTLARLRPDIAAAVRADEISVNAAINDSLAKRYGLPPYVTSV